MTIRSSIVGLALDRKDRPRFRTFARARRAETHYARQLRKVAQAVGDLIRGFPPGDLGVLSRIEAALSGYAKLIEPWAEATGSRMVLEVANRDEKAWAEMAQTMSRALREEIRSAPTGAIFSGLIAQQVDAITSIPREAAERLSKLTIEGLANSTRASEIAKEIMASGEVAKSHANMLARTMVSTTSSKITEARAQHVGSEGYVWRTSGDSDVRPSHRKMEGKFVRWDDPPTLDDYTAHAGCFANCRCWTEVIVPDVIT